MAVLRYSKQRESIKNYLYGRDDHPTADMIYTSIREEYPNISLGAYDAKVRVDYPDQGQKVAEAIIAGEVEKGVLICGTGIGISLAANKVPGIRAAVCSEPYSAEMTVRHNNAQIIAFGARVVGNELAKKILDAFFGATFEGGRHAERVQKICNIEAKYNK